MKSGSWELWPGTRVWTTETPDLQHVAGTFTINAIARSLLPQKVPILSLFLCVQLLSDKLRVTDNWHEHIKSLSLLSICTFVHGGSLLCERLLRSFGLLEEAQSKSQSPISLYLSISVLFSFPQQGSTEFLSHFYPYSKYNYLLFKSELLLVSWCHKWGFYLWCWYPASSQILLKKSPSLLNLSRVACW